MLFHDGGLVEHVAVVDRTGRALGPRLRPTATPLELGQTGDLIALGSDTMFAYVDPATGAAIPGAPGELSPAGTTFLVPTAQGFDLVDRATSAKRHTDTGVDVELRATFSSHGDWVAYPVAIFSSIDGSYEHVLRLNDAHTGAPRARPSRSARGCSPSRSATTTSSSRSSAPTGAASRIRGARS
jgi:hypothetical protein